MINKHRRRALRAETLPPRSDGSSLKPRQFRYRQMMNHYDDVASASSPTATLALQPRTVMFTQLAMRHPRLAMRHTASYVATGLSLSCVDHTTRVPTPGHHLPPPLNTRDVSVWRRRLYISPGKGFPTLGRVTGRVRRQRPPQHISSLVATSGQMAVCTINIIPYVAQ